MHARHDSICAGGVLPLMRPDRQRGGAVSRHPTDLWGGHAGACPGPCRNVTGRLWHLGTLQADVHNMNSAPALWQPWVLLWLGRPATGQLPTG
jgi:hypothetical protein